MQDFFLPFLLIFRKMQSIFSSHMVTCIIKDSSGNELGRFEAAAEGNLLDQAAEKGIEIPFSCHAGACMSCSAKILSGAECIDQEKDGPKYIETDEDVILSCIAGVLPEKVEDDEEHIIELELLG